MIKSNINILSTGILEQKLLTLAESHNILIDVIPFISTDLVDLNDNSNRIRQLLLQPCTVVFTSINAVLAVSAFFSKPPEWSIYCMENATLELVSEKFGKEKVIGCATDAGSLVKKIISNKQVEQLVFFCGNLKRDELPKIAKSNGIEVEEIIVYKTTKTPLKINKKYDGVIFYSPSGVESFFSLNTVSEGTRFFAIGKTTARAFQKFSQSDITISNTPSKQNLIEGLIEQYNNLNV